MRAFTLASCAFAAVALVPLAAPAQVSSPQKIRRELALLEQLVEMVDKTKQPAALLPHFKKLAEEGASPDIRREAAFHLGGLYVRLQKMARNPNKVFNLAAKVFDGLSQSVVDAWGMKAALALGDLRFAREDLNGAIEAYERILCKNMIEPETVLAALGVALVLEKRGDRGKALKALDYGRSVAKRLYEDDRKSIADAFKDIDRALRRLRRKEPDDAAGLLVLGNKELGRKRYSKAIGYYERLLSDFPEAKEADEAGYKKGLGLYLSKRPYEAREEWEKFVEKKPEGAWRGHALVGLGDIALEYDFNAHAAEQFYKAVTSSSSSEATWAAALPDAHERYGICVYMRRDFKQAEKHFAEELGLRPARPFGPGEISSNMAFLLRMCQERKYPVYYHQHVMRGDSRVQTLLFLLSAYAEAGSHEKALKLARRVNGKEFTKVLPVQRAYARMEEGECLRLLLHNKKAIEVLSDFEDKFAKTAVAPLALYEKARVHLTLDEKEAALRTFELVYSRYPKSEYAAKALHVAGYIHYFTEKWREALNLFRTLITRYPRSWEAKMAREHGIPWVREKIAGSKGKKTGR